jgi:hypothetical protein
VNLEKRDAVTIKDERKRIFHLDEESLHVSLGERMHEDTIPEAPMISPLPIRRVPAARPMSPPPVRPDHGVNKDMLDILIS